MLREMLLLLQYDWRNSVLRVVRWSKARQKFAYRYIATRRYLSHLVCCITSCWIWTQQRCYLPQPACTLYGFNFLVKMFYLNSYYHCMFVSRLSFANGKSPNESENNQVHCRLVSTCDKLSQMKYYMYVLSALWKNSQSKSRIDSQRLRLCSHLVQSTGTNVLHSDTGYFKYPSTIKCPNTRLI